MLEGLQGFPPAGVFDQKTQGAVVTFMFAFVVGFLIQRSRWCNASAIRDAILFRSYRNTKPMLLAMMVITFMFTTFAAFKMGEPIHIVAGAYTITGLFLFGVGMVLGGACTVSTWVRSAEGNLGAAWALLYTFVGMFLFSMLWNLFRWPPATYLQSPAPDLSTLSFGYLNAFTIRDAVGGWLGSVVVIALGFLQIALLAFIYHRLTLDERRRSAVRATEEKPTPSPTLVTRPRPAGVAPQASGVEA